MKFEDMNRIISIERNIIDDGNVPQLRVTKLKRREDGELEVVNVSQLEVVNVPQKDETDGFFVVDLEGTGLFDVESTTTPDEVSELMKKMREVSSKSAKSLVALFSGQMISPHSPNEDEMRDASDPSIHQRHRDDWHQQKLRKGPGHNKHSRKGKKK